MIPSGGAIDPDQVVGESYAGVYVAAPRDAVASVLMQARFSGFLGPQEDRWLLAVATNARGTVAAGRRTIDALARHLAAGLGAVAIAVEVDRDRRLRLWAFDGAASLGRFDSAPDPDEDSLDVGEIPVDEFGDPMPSVMLALEESGAFATELARVCAPDRPDLESDPDSDPAEDLEELLDEELTQSESESDRLRAALRLLGLPTWLIASASLPRYVPGGPRSADVLRLRAGRTGFAGLAAGALTDRTRRRFRSDG